ncbi:MAG TPA: hypothetical protein VLR69_10395 [Thermoanaerobaculia bacterium]|nr:hypothetical protein [Thermoanaerobaculia bacterium]
MNKDQLLGELGGLARQEGEAEKARLDERWDRLAAGTLTPEEEAELKALAESSPEARETYEAFRPLGADFQARVVGAINAERAADAPRPEPAEPRSRVLPFRRAVRRIEVWLGTAAAVAAALFFLVRSPALPPLPPYALVPLVGDQSTRGGEPGPASGTPAFDPGSVLTVVAKPPSAVTIPVDARSFLAQGGELFPWERAERGADGAFRFRGPLSRFRPGKWTVWVVVGRPDSLPSTRELQTRLRAGRTRTADWQAISEDLRIGAHPSP